MTLNITRVRAAAANQPPRPIRRKPVGAVDHHMGGYLLGTDNLFQDPGTGYSTNYGIGYGFGGALQVSEYVEPDYVAWGNGNDDMNTRAVSIEHANDRSKYPDLSAKPTEEVHEASAQLKAMLAVRFGWRIDGKLQLVYAELSDYPKIGPWFYGRSIPDFGRLYNVIGHRAVAKKTCPEHLDSRWICDRANRIINEGAPGSEEDLTIMDKATQDYLDKEFETVRNRIESAREVAEEARVRGENSENKADLALRKLGVPDSEFPKPAVPRKF